MRLSDIKRSKMIKRVRLYYCNRELESAVDLKNRSDLWEKAADVEVSLFFVHFSDSRLICTAVILYVNCN